MLSIFIQFVVFLNFKEQESRNCIVRNVNRDQKQNRLSESPFNIIQMSFNKMV